MKDASSVPEVMKAVQTPEAVDLEEEFAQIALEGILSDGVLREIPIVKMGVGGVSIFLSLRDHYTKKKLLRFLAAFEGVSQWERQDMVSRLHADASYNRKVGHHVIELLDRIDSHRKPIMIGHAFAGYATKRIDLTMLQRLITGIERLPPIDIDVVSKVCDAITNNRQDLKHIDPESTYAIISAGFAHVSTGFGGGGLTVTPTCSAFLDLELDRKSES
jgi:hypothetical protein